MSKRFGVIVLLSFSLFFCLMNTSSGLDLDVRSPSKQNRQSRSDRSIPSAELPTLIISYRLYITRLNEFDCLESNPENILSKLRKNMDEVSSRISNMIGFVLRAFIVQNQIRNQCYGYTRIKEKSLRESGVPDESILFVTTPIESFGNRVLVIISSVGPEETIIFSIDDTLTIEVLYDTFHKNEIGNKKQMRSLGGSDRMYSVFGVEVQGPGMFLLKERRDSGSAPVEIIERRFVIDVGNGVFRLAMKLESGNR